MLNYDLFRKLATGRNKDYRFECGWSSFNENKELEKSKTNAEKLQEDGYIMLEDCTINDKTIWLKGSFTEKGKQCIKENNIAIEEPFNINKIL